MFIQSLCGVRYVNTFSAASSTSALGLTLELEQLQYFVDGRGTLQAKKGR